MNILHTVNKSPFERTSLDSCLKCAQPGADVLLIEDGVYAALRDSSVAPRIMDALGRIKLYALGPDLKARGIAEGRLIPGISVIDYTGFVDLAAENAKVLAWL